MTFKEDGDTFHDFRPSTCTWGWNGLGFDIINKKMAKMTAIGLGVKPKDYIILRQAEKDYVYEVKSIEYETNPKDMFTAIVEIVGFWV